MTTLAFDLQLQKDDFHLRAQADVPTEGVIGLIGPSGAGKSSLLRCIAGLEPCQGSIRFGDTNWQGLAVQQRGVGMVFQQPSLFTHLSVRGNLDYAWRRAPADRRLPVLATAERLGIAHLLSRESTSLSGGEAQRVAIARALVAGPSLLMLDEPLAAIDARGRSDVMGCLEQLRAERPVPMLYVSHNLDEVARLADQLLLMDAGTITAQGPVAEMLTRLDLPLALASEAEAILEGTVTRHDELAHVTQVSIGNEEILLARQGLEEGARLRLRIAARDVSLALSRATDSSILNILPGRVVEISDSEPGQRLVRLDVAGQALLARITQRSAQHLGLRSGLELFVQIKSVALA